MDNPVDHIVDLGLVNYVKHPTNKDYIVYRFADEQRAASFEAELIVQKIWFEKGIETEKARPYYLFGIHKHDFKKVSKINYSVEAIHKKPFIPFKFLRSFIFLLMLAAIVLAIVGYCKQQEKLESYNNPAASVNTIQNVE